MKQKPYTDEYIKIKTDSNIIEMVGKFSKMDIFCFRAARDMALTSDYGNFRIGCVLRYKTSIIGAGANMCKSDPEQRKYNELYRSFHEPRRFSPREHSIHAEIAAIKSVPYTKAQSINWSKVKAYVFRICGTPSCQGLSKPCAACCHALFDRGIKEVYFSDDTGFSVMHFSDEIMGADKPHTGSNFKSRFAPAEQMIIG